MFGKDYKPKSTTREAKALIREEIKQYYDLHELEHNAGMLHLSDQGFHDRASGTSLAYLGCFSMLRA